MSKKKRHKAKAEKQPARPDHPATGPAARERYHRRQLWRDALKGILFIGLGLSISFLIEHTKFGKHLELMGYNFLQTQLSNQPAPLAIVDISDLARKDFIVNGEMVTATPRAALKEMIQAIADQQPKAIGIDVDFSPDENGYILPSDPEFFQFCLDLAKQKGVPIFLGIRRTIAKPSAEWLGEAKYQDLAANILVPRDSKRMLSLLKVEDNPAPNAAEEKARPSKTMSALLAEAAGRTESASAFSRFHASLMKRLAGTGLLEKFSERQLEPGLEVQDFLIDYGPLESIETIPATDAAPLRDPSQRARLQGRMVLIGDATLGKAVDTFVVPGRDQPYPGVFLHACAAYTLLKAPLYELTRKGHIAIDVLLSSLILVTIILASFRYADQESRERATQRLEGILTLVIVVAALVVGVVFVRVTRIMWDDFFLVLILLVFHPSIEGRVEKLWVKAKRRGHSPALGHETALREHH
jgi:CHASE2 domain-containing sensor protein